MVERAYNIYSFLHLTLQEYFVARYCIDNQSSGNFLRQVVDDHLTDVKWREVFIIISELLPPYADNFFLSIVTKINKLINERFLMKFLSEIKAKVDDVEGETPKFYMRSVVFYFLLADNHIFDITFV